MCPQGQTVNENFYKEVLEKLRKRIIRVRSNIKNTWVLHHDNVPCYTTTSINQFLTIKNIPMAPQPLYYLCSCDFYLSTITNSLQRTALWDTRKHSNICDRRTENYSSNRVPEHLRTMKTSSPALCGFPRQLLWRK